MTKLYGPGARVMFNGIECTVERSVGGGDYIVRSPDGTRHAVGVRSLTPAHPSEEEMMTQVTEDKVEKTEEGEGENTEATEE